MIGGSLRRIAVTVLGLAAVGFAQMAPSHQPTTQQPTSPHGASPHGQMTVTNNGQNPHGTGSSKLKAFAAECGLPEASEKNVQIFGYSKKSWTALRPKDTGDQYSELARVWSDSEGRPRVATLSESLSDSGDALRVVHLCYSPQGKIRKVSEHYVNLPACDCGRDTETAFDEQGKQTKQSQNWYKVLSHANLETDKVPKNAPPVVLYRSVAELPFANLLKGKNASSH